MVGKKVVGKRGYDYDDDDDYDDDEQRRMITEVRLSYVTSIGKGYVSDIPLNPPPSVQQPSHSNRRPATP